MANKINEKQKILPPEGFVQLWVIINDQRGPGVMGIGRTSWLEGVKAGRFPAPVKIGRTTLWRVDDVRRTITEIGGAV